MKNLCVSYFLLLSVLMFPMVARAEQIKLKSKDAKAFFQLLDKDTMYLVDDFYAKEIYFKDPVVEFSNRDDLKHYYKSAYEATELVTFEIPEVIDDGDNQVVIWIMTMKAKKLNKGRPIVVEGSSYIRYNNEGKAVYHQDYFDMGEMIYAHVPVVRGMVKFVNKRMRKKHDQTY